VNPSALSQPRFAKSPIIMPALAIMNLTVWSFPLTLRFIIDLQVLLRLIVDTKWHVQEFRHQWRLFALSALSSLGAVLRFRSKYIDRRFIIRLRT
jgi:hypothetical protein